METHAPERTTQLFVKERGFVDQFDDSSDDYIQLDGDSDQGAHKPKRLLGRERDIRVAPPQREIQSMIYDLFRER